MQIADVMTPRDELVTVELPGTREDALEYLKEGRFSSVPVIKSTDDGEEFRGLISRETLIEHPDEDQLALLVEEVPTTTGESTIEEVGALMAREDARRIPIVDGQLEGVVTITDIIRAIAEGEVAGDTELSELATRMVNCTVADTPLSVAERELSYADVPYAVVLDETGDTCGMLTEVDVLDVAEVVEGETDAGESLANEDDEWMWEGIKAVGNRYLPTRNVELPDGPVSEFMTDDLLTISDHKTARDAAQTMLTEDIEQIPMVSGDDMVGIVVDMDLLEAFMK